MTKGIRIEGLNDLQKKLKKNIKIDDVKRVVKQNGTELDSKIVKNAEFKKGYQTGTTKRSIALSLENNGLTAVVEPVTEYSPYLEYGTRFMEAQPFVGLGYTQQKEIFKKDMKKLVK